jgi:sugar phosphate isomerase/epimerase
VRPTRREWIGGAAAAAILRAKPLRLPIGCQVYPVRQALNNNFEATLKDLRSSGFETIEMCSPPGYGRDFTNLVKLSAAEMRGSIESAGLRCESCHYGFRELKENLEERIAFARELGLKQMVLSSFGLPSTAALADWWAAAETMNGIAEKIRKAGMAVAYHNHTFEFRQLAGALIYDELLRHFDPQLISLQFQTGVISAGFQAAPYFEKYPGRFLSIHVSDWSPVQKKQTAVGTGEIDWPKLFTAARKGGVKNYFLEMSLDLMKSSVPYLRQLQV